MTLANYGTIQRETSGIYLIGNRNIEDNVLEMPRSYGPDDPLFISGMQGEEEAREKLAACLDDCRILTNVPIHYEDMQSEIDMLIINRKGVTIVEVKNAGGIIAEKDKHTIVQKMTYPNGATLSREMKNPLAQTRREVYIFNKMLSAAHINVWIRYGVYFNRALLVKFHDEENIYTDCCDLAAMIQGGKTRCSSKYVNALSAEIARICSSGQMA